MERKVEDKTQKSENRKPRETAPGNDLKRKLILEMVVAGKQLRLAMETEKALKLTRTIHIMCVCMYVYKYSVDI